MVLVEATMTSMPAVPSRLDPRCGAPICCIHRNDKTRLTPAVDGLLTPEHDTVTVSAPAGGDALHRLASLLHADLVATNETIVARMASEVDLIPQLAAHLIAAGGKRLRPLLTLASARLCGYRGDRQIRLAACVEFIHTATLLHDDVVDESDLRRGLASANAVFGNKASVLVGDFLFARAFQLMVADGSLDVLRILSTAAATIAEGEVLQLSTQNDLGTDIPRYFKVIEGKTAALFSAACEVGAVVAERGAGQCAALAAYGSALGMAFQLVDDALDYAADQGELGKTVGDDFREGKLTYPVLIAYAAGDAAERAFWHRTIELGEQTGEDLATALELIVRHGAIDRTLDRAHGFAEAAKSALSVFPDDPVRALMMDAADYTVSRRH
ncbi:MAG TPA: polyprenyl synthetase family protein [Acidiphilium sp.]